MHIPYVAHTCTSDTAEPLKAAPRLEYRSGDTCSTSVAALSILWWQCVAPISIVATIANVRTIESSVDWVEIYRTRNNFATLHSTLDSLSLIRNGDRCTTCGHYLNYFENFNSVHKIFEKMKFIWNKLFLPTFIIIIFIFYPIF